MRVEWDVLIIHINNNMKYDSNFSKLHRYLFVQGNTVLSVLNCKLSSPNMELRVALKIISLTNSKVQAIVRSKNAEMIFHHQKP